MILSVGHYEQMRSESSKKGNEQELIAILASCYNALT